MRNKQFCLDMNIKFDLYNWIRRNNPFCHHIVFFYLAFASIALLGSMFDYVGVWLAGTAVGFFAGVVCRKVRSFWPVLSAYYATSAGIIIQTFVWKYAFYESWERIASQGLPCEVTVVFAGILPVFSLVGFASSHHDRMMRNCDY